MKRTLKRVIDDNACYYYVDGKKTIGVHSRITGDPKDITGCVDNITGCVTSIIGCVTNISGCVDGIRGCVDGINGCVTGIIGNFDLCEIAEKDRSIGVNIEDLIVNDSR